MGDVGCESSILIEGQVWDFIVGANGGEEGEGEGGDEDGEDDEEEEGSACILGLVGLGRPARGDYVLCR